MRAQPIRVYADTSVFGGVFDQEFAGPSALFFQCVEEGRFALAVSTLVERELLAAPQAVSDYFGQMADRAEICEIGREAERLRDAYIRAGIVTAKSLADALHVAVATVARCAAIVSWNFGHIVHFAKIPFYNAVNTRGGLSPIVICSPADVVNYEEEDFRLRGDDAQGGRTGL